MTNKRIREDLLYEILTYIGFKIHDLKNNKAKHLDDMYCSGMLDAFEEIIEYLSKLDLED